MKAPWMCVVAALLLLLTGPAHGQGPIRAGLFVDRVPVSGFTDTSVTHVSVMAGISLTPCHALELAVGRLEDTMTDPDWTPSQGEAPLQVGLEAFPVQASYVLTVPAPGFPVRPVLSIGGDWASVTDSYQSDTPRESVRSSLLGIHFGAGLRAAFRERVWLALGGEYRFFQENDARPARSLELDGWSLKGGIGIAF
jgi:hypothetical protein